MGPSHVSFLWGRCAEIILLFVLFQNICPSGPAHRSGKNVRHICSFPTVSSLASLVSIISKTSLNIGKHYWFQSLHEGNYE